MPPTLGGHAADVGGSGVPGAYRSGLELATPSRNLLPGPATPRTLGFEIASDKGHDAFLVEWDLLTEILQEALGVSEEEVAASA